MRLSPRIPVQLEAILEHERGNIKQTIIDLSLNGAFVTLSSKAEIGPLVTIRFRPPQASQELKVLARMVRRTREGAGFKFLNLGPQVRYQLWSSLVPLWPNKMKKCPFCAQILTSRLHKECPICHLPLDFQQNGYLQRLPEDSPGQRAAEGVMETKDYYTVEEFARILCVHRKTILRWTIAGKIAFWQVGNSRTIRIPRSELTRHLSLSP